MREYRVMKMYSPELEKDFRIFIMLPKSYDNTLKKYPVLYMHDGHNLFDDKTATYGKSWGIIESYQNIPNLPEIIIVGVETIGDARSDELVPFQFTYGDNGKKSGGKTDLYLTFITTTLKTYIDNEYRTFVSAKNTGIMGSSFGGVASMYAAIKYQNYFSRFGCVSNAWFVIQDQFMELIEQSDFSTVKKIYMDVGTKESSTDIHSENYVKSNTKVYDILKRKIQKDKLKYVISEGAIHNEKDWEKRFPEIINFLFNQ